MNLDPESDIGHIEYKVKIDPQNTERLSHLTTQLLFRITEGNGIALYKIGVTDKGKVCGISKSEMDKSIGYLTQMAKNIKASIISIQYLEVDAASLVSATVVIQLEMAIFEIPVLFLGSGNSGKSSIISYLSHKKLDNGNGKSRIQLFRHKHEFATGKTSCVVPHILNECFTKSSFLISLIDSCGSIKYLHSTYKFLTGSSFDYICLVVDVTVGVDQELKEMIMCVLYFQINCLIVINKVSFYINI
jgi:GTPase